MSGLSAADVRRIVREEIAAHQLVQGELLVSAIVRGLRESRRERGVLFGVDLLPRHAERDQGDGALRDAEALASAAGGVEVEDDNSAGLDRREVPLDPRCTGGVFCPVSGHVEYRGDGRGGFQAVHIGP